MCVCWYMSVCVFVYENVCVWGEGRVCAFSEVEMLDQLFPFIEKQ